MQFPVPWPPGEVYPPPTAFELLVACFVLLFGFIELFIFVLPEKWQRKVNELRFGPAWAKRTKRE